MTIHNDYQAEDLEHRIHVRSVGFTGWIIAYSQNFPGVIFTRRSMHHLLGAVSSHLEAIGLGKFAPPEVG